MDLNAPIYVAGHRGMVGSAIVRELKNKGFTNIITRTREELDLTNQKDVHDFFQNQQPFEWVFMAAAKVGGILANDTYQADFLYENLIISTNVIHAAATFNTKKLLYLGSTCIYPKHAPQPMEEKHLLTGSLEPTNQGYAIAKIAGLKLCEMYSSQYGKSFISAMPTNLYGPGDNFHPLNSHVVPGLMRKFHEAKQKADSQVTVWGTGTPTRDLLHADDLARALCLVMEKYEEKEFLNIGSGEEISIRDLAYLVKDIVGFQGEIQFDPTKPDGTPRKSLEISKIRNLGWEPKYSLKTGLQNAYQWALENRIFP